jgi:septal ring factor EnvC (AmiA/AmiB activator)
VPHPGLDIDAEFGTIIRTIFDGQVVFASWMRGYGLTAIVDHGGGLLSVYAHASVLMIEPGEKLMRGQRIGAIGDTGSLRGPYLYFEIRENGTPTDPGGWLRPR